MKIVTLRDGTPSNPQTIETQLDGPVTKSFSKSSKACYYCGKVGHQERYGLEQAYCGIPCSH